MGLSVGWEFHLISSDWSLVLLLPASNKGSFKKVTPALWLVSVLFLSIKPNFESGISYTLFSAQVMQVLKLVKFMALCSYAPFLKWLRVQRFGMCPVPSSWKGDHGGFPVWGKEAKFNPQERKQSQGHRQNHHFWPTIWPNTGPGHHRVQMQERGWPHGCSISDSVEHSEPGTHGARMGVEASRLFFQGLSLNSRGGIWNQVPKRPELQNCALEKAKSTRKKKKREQNKQTENYPRWANYAVTVPGKVKHWKCSHLSWGGVSGVDGAGGGRHYNPGPFPFIPEQLVLSPSLWVSPNFLFFFFHSNWLINP